MENNIGIWIAAGMFALVLIPPFLNLFQKKGEYTAITGNVVNYDVTMRELWYFSRKSIREIIEALSASGTYEDYTYCFDQENMVLSLTNVLLGDTTRYIVILESREGGTRIRLYRKEGMHRTNKIGMDVMFFETFFCKAILDAEPIPYHKEDL